MPRAYNLDYDEVKRRAGWRFYLRVPEAKRLLYGLTRWEFREEDPGPFDFDFGDEGEFGRLCDEVEEHGVTEPIIWTQFQGDDWILAGDDQLDAMAALGKPIFGNDGELAVPNMKRDLVGDETPDDATLKITVGLRRHITKRQKRELVIGLLRLRWSDRRIGRDVNYHHSTVGSIRARAYRTGEIRQLNKTVGLDGKSRARPVAKQPRKPRCTFCNKPRSALYVAKWRTNYPGRICILCVESALTGLAGEYEISLRNEPRKPVVVGSLKEGAQNISVAIKNLRIKSPRR
jgi:hypothetical protein